MITYTYDSIFDSDADCLVNTVNCVGVMGKGIALEFKKRYPEMYKAYKIDCKDGNYIPGITIFYFTKTKIICNFATKNHWRNPSKLEWIDKGLELFSELYKFCDIKKASFPELGCGNGGLNWEKEVKPLMEKYLSDLDIPVYIHNYRR